MSIYLNKPIRIVRDKIMKLNLNFSEDIQSFKDLCVKIKEDESSVWIAAAIDPGARKYLKLYIDDHLLHNSKGTKHYVENIPLGKSFQEQLQKALEERTDASIDE